MANMMAIPKRLTNIVSPTQCQTTRYFRFTGIFPDAVRNQSLFQPDKITQKVPFSQHRELSPFAYLISLELPAWNTIGRVMGRYRKLKHSVVDVNDVSVDVSSIIGLCFRTFFKKVKHSSTNLGLISSVRNGVPKVFYDIIAMQSRHFCFHVLYGLMNTCAEYDFQALFF